MHLEYITRVVDLTEVYSRVIFFLILGSRGEGQMKINTNCMFLGKDTKACKAGSVDSLDL